MFQNVKEYNYRKKSIYEENLSLIKRRMYFILYVKRCFQRDINSLVSDQ